jgi:hypothetical protein
VPVVICIVGRGDLTALADATPPWATTVVVDPDEPAS